MTYNIHSFRIYQNDYDGKVLVDYTAMAHAFLGEFGIVLPKFETEEEAMLYARKAALHIARKLGENYVRFCISGYESDEPSLEFKKSDFFKTYEVNITIAEAKEVEEK